MFGVDAEGRCSNEKVLRVLEELFAGEEPPGMINMVDVRSMIDEEGESYILTGEGIGDSAIADAINIALDSPIADKILPRALSIFLNIDASADVMSMMAVSDAASTIAELSHPDAEILWNVSIDEELGDRVKALLIVTRLNAQQSEEMQPKVAVQSEGEKYALEKIHSDNAPAAVGPYSQAIEVNGMIFCSGQIAIDPTVGWIVATDIEGQAEQCCMNLSAVLTAAGSSLDNVVKTTCFLADIADFKKFNAIYEKYFVGKPARSCVAVKDLPAGALCEIEAIAVK